MDGYSSVDIPSFLPPLQYTSTEQMQSGRSRRYTHQSITYIPFPSSPFSLFPLRVRKYERDDTARQYSIHVDGWMDGWIYVMVVQEREQGKKVVVVVVVVVLELQS
jgi:hypothetical protein